jgi:ADP-ribose pyrophosphatase YjhB (NUDIX family)
MVVRAAAVEPELIVDRWSAETGYVTPKVGLAAAIHDEHGRVLLLQRPDSGNWSLPAGFAEVGESPAGGLAREVAEETGLIVVPRRLLGLYDSWLHGSTNPQHIYAVVFVCEARGGTLQLTPEALDLGFYGPDTLPSPISKSHQRPIEDALAAWRDGRAAAWFDPL